MSNLIVNKLWSERTNPSVTILTPVYNRRDLLPRAMASVQHQSCKDLEYISSSGLRLFLTIRKEASSKDGKVIIKNINDEIKKVFMMTGFFNLFEIITE